MILKYLLGSIEFLNRYSNLILVALEILGFIYIREEYILKIRPFVIVVIGISKKDESWDFDVILVNNGQYPGKAEITNALLKFGDETYPTVFNTEISLAPNERQKLAPIGHINELGRKKIIGHEYKINRVEIIVSVVSGFISDKQLKYNTNCEYFVDVSGDDPVLLLISENLT